MLAKFFRLPFAGSGDKTAVPETVQGNGSISYPQGYGPHYQADLRTDPNALAIERDKFNELLYQITNALKVLQAFGGASEFIAAADNGGSPYPYAQFARVLYAGKVYESVTGGNTTTPPSSSWVEVSIFDTLNGVGTWTFAPVDAPAPLGYLYANGQAVSRTVYARLFALYGTTFGAGDGSTTFNLPDGRSMFIRGWDDGRGVDTGRAIGSVQADAFRAHTHTGSTSTDGTHSHNVSTGFDASGTAAADGTAAGSFSVTSSAGAHNHTLTIASAGGAETRPINLAVKFYIKF